MPEHPYKNMTDIRNFEAQQTCPSCQQPMGGVGWRCACGKGLSCHIASCWMGPFGHCETCSTEEVAEAIQQRISKELLRLADSYEIPTGIDVWEWTAELARMVADGELTKPIQTDLPF